MVTNTPLDLDRRFVEIADDTLPDPTARRILARYDDGGTDWKAILEHPRIVVLGEAGTGKTTEFCRQTAILKQAGTAAFFCRIEALAEFGLVQSLEPLEDEHLFTAWRNETGPGVFFLDSVDEARLRDKDFRRALRNFRKELDQSALARATVLISCRPSDWRGQDDRNAVTEILPPPPDKSGKPGDTLPPVKVFAFAPLNKERGKLLAATHGVTDADAMLQALSDAHAEDFADRPRDVEWVSRYWLSHRRIGSLTEMIEENIKEKLKEENSNRERRDPLTPDQGFDGARQLAAAVTFCKRDTVRLSDDGPGHDLAAEALDTRDALPGWTAAQRAFLLTRALFDEATYGRVRFHHRSVVEYLTARWLHNLLEAGSPVREIAGLLFKNSYGQRVAVPSQAPVTAWLAGWSPPILAEARAVAPELLIAYGDPKALPIAVRAGILVQYCQRLHSDSALRDSFSWGSLDRFTAPELGPTVRDLLSQYPDHREITPLLLRLAAHGRMTDCADAALAYALSGDSDFDVYAIRAVARCGSSEHRRKLADHAVRYAGSLSERFQAETLEACIPGIMTLEELNTILSATPTSNRTGSDYLVNFLSELIEKTLPTGWLAPLLDRLLTLLQTPPLTGPGETKLISERHAKLIEALEQIVIRLLNSLASADLPLDRVASAVLLLEHCNRYHFPLGRSRHIEAISSAIGRHPALKRVLLWQKADHHQQAHGQRATWLLQLNYDGFWQLGAEDEGWLLDDLRKNSDANDRSLALDAVMRHCWATDKAEAVLDRIKAAVGSAPALAAEIECSINPPPRQEPEWEREHREQRQKREEEKAHAMEESRIALLKETDKIRSGEAVNALSWLYHRMDDSRLTRWSKSDLAEISIKFGPEIADAAREGFKRFWRTWTPPLPHEKEKPNETDNRVPIGLSGLAIEVEDGLDFTLLPAAEAMVATTYAADEMNGFPDWITPLAKHHPTAVTDILRRGIQGEWPAPAAEGYAPELIGKIGHSPAEIRDLLAPEFLACLDANDPVSLSTLRPVLHTLLSSDAIDRTRLSTLAETRTRASITERPRLMAWLPAWLALDGSCAISFLEALAAGLEQPDADALVMEFCAALHYLGRDWTVKLLPDDLDALVRLIDLLHQRVRPEDDLRHDGVFSPGARDNAQEIRSGAFEMLCRQPGKATYLALLDIARRRPDGVSADYCRRRARERAELDAEGPAWLVDAVVQMQREHERAPRSPADLFTLALNRLDDIKREIEDGDSSDRSLITAETPEVDIQNWLATRLRNASRNRYSVIREEEVINRKKPDIRLHTPAAGLISIEIKCAQSWTVPELESALTDQLVGQYLRDARSRHGILVLTYVGGKKRWKKPGARRMIDFAALTDHLAARALRLEREDPRVDGLRVVALDFTTTA